MTSREWAVTLAMTGLALIAGGLVLGLTPAVTTAGASCGSPWMPNYSLAGDPATTLSMATCATAFGSRGELAQLPVVLGVLTLVGIGLVKMALAGRREANAATERETPAS